MIFTFPVAQKPAQDLNTISVEIWGNNKTRLARSSADSMGDSILSTVRKAARLAVYEEVTTRMNSHHIVAMMRVDTDLMAWQCETFSQNGLILWDNVRTLLHKRTDSKPHCVQQRELVDQNLWKAEEEEALKITSWWLHGCGLSHSYGLNLGEDQCTNAKTTGFF